MRPLILSLLALLLALSSLAADKPTGRSDAAAKTAGAKTPKEAVKGFVLATETNDAEAVRPWLHTETDVESEAADVYVGSTTGQIRVQHLVRERFGEEGFKEFSGGSRPPPPRPKDPAEIGAVIDAMLKDAKVRVEGDKAVLTHPMQPEKPIELRKTDDGWKPLFTSLHGQRDPALLKNFIKQNRLYGPAYHKTADEIEAGRYKSVAEIQRVLSDRTTDPEEMKRQLEQQRQLEEKARQRRKK